MSKVLSDYFGDVQSYDIKEYGYGRVANFLEAKHVDRTPHWIITNPPFRLAEEFFQKAFDLAACGVAVLVRTTFIESVGRYERVFQRRPMSKLAQFSERVPMVKGRLDKRVSTATSYAWMVWHKASPETSRLIWIPRCRKALEKDGDYEL